MGLTFLFFILLFFIMLNSVGMSLAYFTEEGDSEEDLRVRSLLLEWQLSPKNRIFVLVLCAVFIPIPFIFTLLFRKTLKNIIYTYKNKDI